nr:tyrosinase cofactor [Streptomyces albireticuli]
MAVAGAALAAPTAMAATRTATAAMTDHSGHGGHSGPAAFDEVYQGRRIVGKPATGEHAAHGGFTASIDGKELHLMQNADGTWISVVNHYETFATPLAVTRAAVDKLRGATLVPIAT